MDEGAAPALEVGFVIDTRDSFGSLIALDGQIDSTVANAMAEFQRVERATKGMLDLSGAKASVTTFGNAVTKEGASAARELNKVEKAGEALSRQMTRQAATFGKTAQEIRQAKVETAALAAEQRGLSELAGRLRAQEAALYADEFAAARRSRQAAEEAAEAKVRAAAQASAAAEAEADAVRRAAGAYNMFEAVARQRMAAYRQQQAEESAAARSSADLAARADRLRAAIDPSAAAQQRFNREMAEARMLISGGAISLDDYVAKLRQEQAALDASSGAMNRKTAGAVQNRMAFQGASYQFQDFITQVSMGANPVNAFAVQGAQLAGQFSEVKGRAGDVARFFMGPWGLAITAGMMLLGPLVTKLFEKKNKLDDAVKKLRENAQQTEMTRRATELYNRTLDGMIERIRESNRELRESVRTQQQVEAMRLREEQGKLQGLQRQASTARTQLQQAERDLARYRAMAMPAGEAQGRAHMATIRALDDRAKALRGQLQSAQAEAATVEENVRRAQQPMLSRQVEASLDRRTAATERYTAAQQRLSEQQAIGAGNSRMVTEWTGTRSRQIRLEGISDAEYQRRLRTVTQERDAAIRAAQEAERAGRGDGVERFRSQAQAIGVAGRELQGLGLRVGENEQFGGLTTTHSDRDHNRSAIDLNVGRGIVEADVPRLRAQFDELARLYQSRGYTVLWNGRVYPAGGNGPGGRAGGHRDHMHIKAPSAIVGRATQSSTARQEIREFREDIQRAEEEQAAQAQITNLYALARAYEATGGAALIAAARVKAESDAIRDGGDVEARVAREVNLQIAQRVANAAQGSAAMREQASVQAAVNAQVAAGTVPASQASELVRDQMADLPLLAAIQAATASNNVEGAQRATAALEAQRAARRQLTAAEREAAFRTTMETGAGRLAELREELRLVGATEAVRDRALTTLRATEEARRQQLDPAQAAAYIGQQLEIFDLTKSIADAQRNWNDALAETADRWDLIAQNVQSAAGGMADAFGPAGAAIGDMASLYADYHSQRARLDQQHQQAVTEAGGNEAALARENARYALQTAASQVALYGDMASAAKGFFKEGSAGYRALAVAEKAFRAVQFALSVRAMAQDMAETARAVANSVFRAGKYAVEAVAKALSSLPFPANLAAGAATAAALAAIGISVVGSFGGGKKGDKPNEGTGTVFGDSEAKSESIKRAIDALKEVDTLTNSYARDMAASLRSIESRIGGLAALVVRAGDLNASGGVKEGFDRNLVGSVLGKIPIIGGILGGLFGSTTKVTASGLSAGSQSLGSILDGGFDASYYSDVQKKSKMFGLTTGTKNSTKYTDADAGLETQFALLLRSFNDAIVAAAGPLGASTSEIQNRLNSFVVSIGKIDLKGLTGEQIQEKLSAVFGAAADQMANAAFPGLAQFQRVGEGAFETLVRVASTLEAVTGAFDLLGQKVQGLDMAGKLGLVDQFGGISQMTDAVDAYFKSFYSKEEQVAARTEQMRGVFASLNLSMPATLASYRQLAEAQDLTTEAGRETYALLLKLAPAFADLQSSLEGAKSAADIATERADLERQLLQLQGNTGALRARDLAKIDASNRMLQEQVWSLQDAQQAAKAAEELRKAWTAVGDSIMDEVRRIRGLDTGTGEGSFAALLGRFNAVNAAARGGDMDAAKDLPRLSQALLAAAANSATSRQELARVQAQTAASLEATFGVIGALSTAATATATTNAALLGAAGTSQAANGASNDNGTDRLASKLDDLHAELERMRSDSNAALATVASNTGRTARKLEDVTTASGGDAISTVAAA